MAAKTQPATSSSRLSLFGFGSLSRAATSSHARPAEPVTQDQDDDWYIPYNGPVEQPTRPGVGGDRDSWGDVLSSWLSEEGDGLSRGAREDGERRTRSTRSRAVSSASQYSTTSGYKSPHARANIQPRPSVPSFIDLDKAGGVGASPMPAERTSRHGSPQASPPPPGNNNRASLASILSFGKKGLQHSTSMDQLPQERAIGRRRGNTSASTSTPPTIAQSRQRANDHPAHGLQQDPIAEDNEYYYSSLLVHSSTRGVPSRQSPFGSLSTEPDRSHPYAATSQSNSDPPRSAPPAPVKGKTRFLDPSKLSITLLDPRGPKVPSYLKPSPRNSLLKASLSTPNLRDIPRGKQRWLSAETWCDALIHPRPRFAMRLVEGGPSGRIVSPPGSPISPSDANFPVPGLRSRSRSGSAQSHGTRKELKKARSMGNLFGAASVSSAREQVVAEGRVSKSPVANEAGSSQLKPHRPKSWALDDMVLPSPVPSLAQVMAEGERLKAEREKWQTKATQSFQNKRARQVRARSKSMSASQARQRTHSTGGAFDFLAERTLLGNQARPPTIHVHAPPVPRSYQTSSTGGVGVHTLTSVFSHSNANSHSRTTSGSRTRSHGHSNSMGHSVSYKSISTDSAVHGHARSQSLGKSALKMVRSTAVGAAAFCGFNGVERSPSIPGDEKGDAIESAFRSNGTKVVGLGNQTQMGGFGDRSVVVASPADAPQGISGLNGASPTPSGLSVSAEGVGLAISSPEDQPHKYAEPIVIPSHPYAQGSSYYKQPVKLNIPEYTSPDSVSPSPQSADGVNKHRQAVTRPYVHLAHPYATGMVKGKSGSQQLDVAPGSPSLYAELTPGLIREFDPNEIQYSPYSASPTQIGGPLPRDTAQNTAPVPTGHPYGPTAARYSELGFGEALAHTLRNRQSLDSGLGTSEAEGHNQGRDVEYTSPPVVFPDTDELNKRTPGAYFAQDTPGHPYQRSADASSQALVSSPLEHAAAFRRRGSSGTHLSTGTHHDHGRSAGSSPGLVSQASSPPLSPRPLQAPGDLDRFRDLFYQPVDRVSVASDSPLSRPTLSSRQNSLPIDVSSQASRSVSGLTNLARQLSEDLEELREVERDVSGDLDRGSPMWGRRYGGLRGSRPDDMDDPNVVLTHSSQMSSDSSSPGDSTLPLRLPTDTPFSNPAANFPEDIDVDEAGSSRASSELEDSNFHEDPSQYLRVREVEVGSTPPIILSPHRKSTRLSVIEDELEGLTVDANVDAGQNDDDLSPLRVPSQYSSLISPLSPNAARSSYMTSDTDPSRMSGLSDFPVPPHQSNSFVSPPSGTSYFAGDAYQIPSDTRPSQTLLREPSKDTFGNQHDYDNIGEAF